MKIGIFDSGIGGLTVLNEAIKKMPHGNFIYFADTYNVPYGTKPKNEVKKFIFEVADFLDSKSIDAMLIACNTATSIGVEELRQKYGFPVIGMEPAVRLGLNLNINKRKVLVLATPLTLKLDKYNRLIDNLDAVTVVDSLALPGLVEFAEKYVFEKSRISNYLDKVLSPYNFDEYSAIVLGCTHFIYYRDYIKDMVPDHVAIVDGNIGTVNRLIELTDYRTSGGSAGAIEYYQSTRKGIKAAQFDKYMHLLK